MLGHISAMLQGCLVCSPGRQSEKSSCLLIAGQHCVPTTTSIIHMASLYRSIVSMSGVDPPVVVPPPAPAALAVVAAVPAPVLAVGLPAGRGGGRGRGRGKGGGRGKGAR